tara:strand:+ start:119 stop:340 length:222 start_codon:yes stop_codon:yes gene_type:complete
MSNNELRVHDLKNYYLFTEQQKLLGLGTVSLFVIVVEINGATQEWVHSEPNRPLSSDDFARHCYNWIAQRGEQ